MIATCENCQLIKKHNKTLYFYLNPGLSMFNEFTFIMIVSDIISVPYYKSLTIYGHKDIYGSDYLFTKNYDEVAHTSDKLTFDNYMKIDIPESIIIPIILDDYIGSIDKIVYDHYSIEIELNNIKHDNCILIARLWCRNSRYDMAYDKLE